MQVEFVSVNKLPGFTLLSFLMYTKEGARSFSKNIEDGASAEVTAKTLRDLADKIENGQL